MNENEMKELIEREGEKNYLVVVSRFGRDEHRVVRANTITEARKKAVPRPISGMVFVRSAKRTSDDAPTESERLLAKAAKYRHNATRAAAEGRSITSERYAERAEQMTELANSLAVSS